MSDDHKAALAQGRAATSAVKAYVEALAEVNKPKPRGRKRTVEQIEAQLAQVRAEIVDAEPLQKVLLASQEYNLEAELKAKQEEAAPVDLSELEAGFIAHAKAYAESKGIPREAWDVVKVPKRVLRAAGIPTSGTATGSSHRRRGVGTR